jgi:hypothetical protein
MTTLAIIFGVLAAMAIFMGFLVHRAPHGYQDETGFHDGIPPQRRFEPGLHVINSMSDFDTPSSRSGEQRAADGEAPAL